MKKTIYLAMGISLMMGLTTACSNTKTTDTFVEYPAIEEGAEPLPDNEATRLTQRLGMGWNLGNHFDSFQLQREPADERSYWWDGAMVTEDLYKNIYAAGIRTVRIPVTWGQWQGPAPEYTISPDFMALIRRNVEWARDNGLNVILNTHHDEYWLDVYQAVNDSALDMQIRDRLTKTWLQIGAEFEREGDYLIFEGVNEIHGQHDGQDDWGNGECQTDGGKQFALVNTWNQVAVDAIRATGGNNATRLIGVSGYAANPWLTMMYQQLPNDPANRLIVSVHCYDPFMFTLIDPLDETFGWRAGTEQDEAQLVHLMKTLCDTYIRQGIPCYMGEMGCSRHETELGEQCREYYSEVFCRACRLAGIAPMVWDNQLLGVGGEHHVYFDHNDGRYVDEAAERAVKKMVRAVMDPDREYTIESIKAEAPAAR